MVVGVGVDIIEVARIRAALERPRTGERFRARVFTPAEINYCSRRRNAYESYAARFAAKEAVIKTLGRACGWREIEVTRTNGPPQIRVAGRAAAYAETLRVERWWLSLSHSDTMAIAYVVAESG